MNLPNKMTLLRIILIPVFMVVLYWGFPGATWVALAIFIGIFSSQFVKDTADDNAPCPVKYGNHHTYDSRCAKSDCDRRRTVDDHQTGRVGYNTPDDKNPERRCLQHFACRHPFQRGSRPAFGKISGVLL